jgi:hypothetical protein
MPLPRLKVTLAGFFLILTIWSSSLALSVPGNLNGTVSDAEGAVVPGATIEVTNEATGDKRRTITNEIGAYIVPHLPIGVYTVTAHAAGFAPSTVKNVKITVSFYTTQDLTLKPRTRPKHSK